MLLILILIETSKYLVYQNGFVFNNVPFSHATAMTTILPNLLLLQSWLPTELHATWNLPSWSISIEYYLYIIFFMTSYIKGYLKYLLWLSIVMLSLFLLKDNNSYINRGLSSFFIGTITYLFYQKITFSFNKHLFSLFEIILLVATVVIISSSVENKFLYINIIFSLIVLVFAYEKGVISKLLLNKIPLYLGKISYSIYMVHFVIIQIFIAFTILLNKYYNLDLFVMDDGKRYITFGGAIYNNLFIIFISLLVIIVANYTYKHIELRWQKNT
jgi:peptidoglycan/LPS O-acetylase OafA/YrhL